MNKKAIIRFSALALLAGGVFAGCQSGNTDGGDVDHTSTQYDPGESGRMRLELVDGDELAVGLTTGFRVYATDSQGAPVTQMRVTCDTEDGLALIEPTSGVESTDSNGQISGRLGCENPGSYLLACRLQGVSARRQSVTVKCTGDRPIGFNGFPGAGGGTLGGGSADNDTITTLRISSVRVSDNGSSEGSTTSIDTEQGVCNSGGTPTVEPFFDTSATFTITNNSPFIFRAKSLRYRISNAFADGRSFTSSSIGLSGDAAAAIDANGGAGTASTLIFDANGSGKRYIGSTANIDISGVRNVNFTLTLENDLGQEVEATTTVALSFDSFNGCSS